jgi:Siphovirus ReqiPepy6 Gp37-like protein
MELYTLNKSFQRVDLIEEFDSLIWTERYYGDSECEVVVPLQRPLLNKLEAGTFLAIGESREPMHIETANITDDGKLKVQGISICSWLNNRFVRTSDDHRQSVWKIRDQKPQQVLRTIVNQMCTKNSDYLNNRKDMGLGSAARAKELIIPGLSLTSYSVKNDPDKKLNAVLVPYGPVYDALRKIAEQHKIGIQVFLNTDYTLRFRTYKGTNRTSNQKANKVVRFSPVMDSLAKTSELRSIADFKTLVYSYASNLEKVDADPGTGTNMQDIQTTPGVARRSPQVGKYTGFDLRAEMTLEGDIKVANDINKTDPRGDLAGMRAELRDILDNRAGKEMHQHPFVKSVDGEVAPTNLFQYGRDYELGDLIEVQGASGFSDVSRVTEYIRSQDSNGENAYPTVAVDPD